MKYFLSVPFCFLWHSVGKIDALLTRRRTAFGWFIFFLFGLPLTLFFIAVSAVMLTNPETSYPSWADPLTYIALTWIFLSAVILVPSGSAFDHYVDSRRKKYNELMTSANRIQQTLSSHSITGEATQIFPYSTIDDWLTVPLPFPRVKALFEAGIPPEHALKKETRRMTGEDLTVYAALNGWTTSQVGTNAV